jgi:hypothetical protein
MRAYERSWVLSISEPMKATSCPIRYVPLTFGALHVGELWASRPGGADRTRRHIHLMEADLVKVDVVAQGEVGIEQDGRQARLQVGDYAFVDLSRPAHWTNSWSVRVLAIAFPRQLLAASYR